MIKQRKDQSTQKRHIIPPCKKCPYTLGEVHTFTNPCIKCKENGYNMYDIFLRQGAVK